MQEAMGQGRVLVVDDDPDVRLFLKDTLTDEGFDVVLAHDARSALEALTGAGTGLDLVLLDVSLPSGSGMDVLTEIRRRSDIPVIFVTGRGAETDRVVGLRMGADDYVVKPFSVPELLARMQSVLRRSRPAAQAPERLQYDWLCIDSTAREVLVRGQVVDTTAKEFDLLAFLAQSPRRVFTREQLLDQVWGSSVQWQDPATVTEHVRRIRRKIEDDPDQPRWLRTVRGVGYRFEP